MQQVCAWMTNLELDYAAMAFEKDAVDGVDLAEFSKADFVSIVTSGAGAIADITLVTVDSYFSQLVPISFLFFCTCPTQARTRLKPKKNGAPLGHILSKCERPLGSTKL